MKWLALVVGLVMASSTTAFAEPVGRWFSGFGQGTVEYGLKNDSAGSDYFYIACAPKGASISITVSGRSAPPNSDIFVAIDDDELTLYADERGDVQTQTHVDSDNFRALWSYIRNGHAMHVRFLTGESTVFKLKGTLNIFDTDPCDTQFDILYVK